MSVKTITIDMAAYTLLSRHKNDGQSFSQVIKTHFGTLPTAAAFRTVVRGLRVSGPALDAMEKQVQSRRAHPARAVTR